MKRKMTMVLMSVVCLASILWAGDLNPSAPPTTGTMKPLDDVEPRIAIHQTDIPLTISTSGSYYLAENVSCSGSENCISVNANDVTIDLCGFTMTGSDSSNSYGVYISNQDNVEIRNGTIRDFYYAVYETSATGKNHHVINVRMLSCPYQGIYLQDCSNCQVKDCTIADSGTSGGTFYGIYVGVGSIISGNTICNNGISSSTRTFCIYAGNDCTVSGNVVYNNGTSSSSNVYYGINVGDGCTVTGNIIHDLADSTASSLYIYGINGGESCIVTGNTCYSIGTNVAGFVWAFRLDDGCTVTNNASYDNGYLAGYDVKGIYVGINCVVKDNTAHDNGTSAVNSAYGIQAGSGCMVTGNCAYNNGTSSGGNVCAGIYASSGCTVTGNSSYSNGTSATATIVYGIYAGAGGTVTCNTARSNGTSATGGVIGLSMGGNNLVDNNTAYGNNGTNMNAPASCVLGTNCAP